VQRLKDQKPLKSVRLPGEHWSHINERIGGALKKHYQACMTDELPPRLRDVLKELNSEEPERSEDNQNFDA
jgi:hypothetical protein